MKDISQSRLEMSDIVLQEMCSLRSVKSMHVLPFSSTFRSIGRCPSRRDSPSTLSDEIPIRISDVKCVGKSWVSRKAVGNATWRPVIRQAIVVRSDAYLQCTQIGNSKRRVCPSRRSRAVLQVPTAHSLAVVETDPLVTRCITSSTARRREAWECH